MTNLKSFGIDDIILLFSRYDDSIPIFFEKKYGAQCFVYPDDRRDKSYIPSIKPYLWWQFLKDNLSAEQGEYFYMDADVIFREIPDFKKLHNDSHLWFGSNTEGYLGLDYIHSKGPGYLASMAEIVGISQEQVDTLRGRSAGAQWLIIHPKVMYWKKVYKDSTRLYRYFTGAERNEVRKHGKGYVPLQKWTAEMWAMLWNMPLFGIQLEISLEFDFAFATDPVSRWDEVKILHNAGITADMKDCFFKGRYFSRSPFADDLSFVNKQKCSYKYVQALKRVEE
ncbi:MAG: hypothetical protein ACE3JK_14560 [Sporolactobacillus sp.]